MMKMIMIIDQKPDADDECFTSFLYQSLTTSSNGSSTGIIWILYTEPYEMV